jgi:hypothetical protein
MVKRPCFATFMLSKGKSQINPREFMILNKFRPVSLLNMVKSVSLQLLAVCLFSCNKTASENANKAYVGMTHVAYGVDSLNLILAGVTNSLFPVPIAFGQNSGTAGNAYYDTATSRINNMFLYSGSFPDTTTLLHGNSAFQQGGHYSIFVYDSLNQQSINLIIFQDNPVFVSDTVTNIRYVNFSPGPVAWGLKLINTRHDSIPQDTIVIPGNNYIGYNPNPSLTPNYSFISVLIGNYNVFAFTDSSNPHVSQGPPVVVDSTNFRKLGPLSINQSINYYLYLQGFDGDTSMINKFQLKQLPLN